MDREVGVWLSIANQLVSAHIIGCLFGNISDEKLLLLVVKCRFLHFFFDEVVVKKSVCGA